MRLPFFSGDLLEDVELEVAVRDHLLQPTVFLLQLPQPLDVGGLQRAEVLPPAVDRLALTPCFLATSGTGFSSASRRIVTICSSVNRVFFMAPSSGPRAPFSQASAGPKNARQVTPLERIQQFVGGILERGGVQFFALDGGDQVVGWCDINRHHTEGYRHSGVLGMGLLPEYRGRGIGARLAVASINAARMNGIERIQLTVFASNQNAIALYRKLGFVEEGVRRRARLLDGRYDDNMEMALLDPPVSR